MRKKWTIKGKDQYNFPLSNAGNGGDRLSQTDFDPSRINSNRRYKLFDSI